MDLPGGRSRVPEARRRGYPRGGVTPREAARYGLRALRIGEASHPGPQRPRRPGCSTLLWSIVLLLYACPSLRSCVIPCTHQLRTNEQPLFSASHRSKSRRAEMRRLAQQQQLDRAAFELSHDCPSYMRSRGVSRGTAKLYGLRRGSTNAEPAMPTLPLRRICAHSLRDVRMGPREQSRYGYRGQRIGEASNPGPLMVERSRMLTQLHDNVYTGNIARHARPLSPMQLAVATRPEGAAKNVAKMFVSLARRAASSSPSAEAIPEPVRQQRWSALNVPLMWAAASDDRETHAILEWIGQATANAPTITLPNGESAIIAEAVKTG